MSQIGRLPIKLDKQQIVSLYNSGLSSQQIAPFFSVSGATIIRRLKLWNVPFRYNYPAWNKGLTTLTDERVRLNSEKTRRMKGHNHTIEARQKMSMAHKGQNTWSKGSKKTEETRIRNSIASRRMWADSEYRAKVIQGMIRANHQRPTKPEQRLLDIVCTNNLPFKYTGDGSFIIHGVNPDFVNSNGAKLVIEVFGDYWHNNQRNQLTWKRTELGRIMLFNSYGFKCIVFWESELELLSDKAIIERIENETRRVSRLHGSRIKGETGA